MSTFDKWLQAFECFFAMIEIPALVLIGVYVIWKFSLIVGIVLFISLIIHIIGKHLIKSGKIDDMILKTYKEEE